jgi:hypothetical protein
MSQLKDISCSSVREVKYTARTPLKVRGAVCYATSQLKIAV